MKDPLALAQEWFDRGDRDLDAAQLLHDEHFHTDVIAYHLQQAIEKYLKGYLLLNDVRPPRIHDLDTLLNLASTVEPDLYDPFIDLCEKATRYYLEERYPPGLPAEYSHEEIGLDLDLTWELVRTIRMKMDQWRQLRGDLSV
jgi:HEPN domain-containing protein